MLHFQYILKQNPLADGTFRIAMRLIRNRKKKVISLKYSCNPDNFFEGRLLKAHKHSKKINKYLQDLENRVDEINNQFDLQNIRYTLSDLVDKVFETNNEELTIWDLFDHKIASNEIKPKTSKAYRDTKSSLQKFREGLLLLEHINPSFIQSYINHLKRRNSNDGGIRFFIRHLKVIVRIAIERKKPFVVSNPFLEVNISRYNGKPIKKALTAKEMSSFLNVDLTERPDLIKSFYIAKFSFYCRGINFVDIIRLKWSDISGNRITYRRSKTGKIYIFTILSPALDILQYFRKFQVNTYVFPYIKKEDLSEQQFENLRHRSLSNFNSDIKSIAKIANIDKHITSYAIRHTYATLLHNKGASSDVICEAMGHSDPKVTQSYLKEFGDDILDKEHEKLLDI
ncbi:tyrosine-type recombinase/integrase [Gillisia sp. JM1]|uniref:tyrosine-type recombinase/integrase n=1 Tax=Gillisia sp. JM1 TaxID=1283286 RepID=UPI00041A9497|nr:tyrosine-type recombinase/integrase [Gillisia sp. JM1]